MKRKKIILPLILTMTLLTGCGLEDEEELALDFVTEIHTESKRNLDKISNFMGRTKTKEGIAHIPSFLKPEGTVWVGSKNDTQKDRKQVYIYFSPEMTSGPILRGVIMEKRGESWIYSGDIEVKNLPKVDFETAEKKGTLKQFGISEWEETDVEID